MIAKLREELRKARTLAESSDMAGVLCALDQALADLADTRMITMAHATDLLGIRSAATLRVLLHSHGVDTKVIEGEVLVSLSDVARIDTAEWIERVRESDRLHDLADAFGFERDMTQEEMDALEAGRPGTPPWKKPLATALDRPA